MISSRHNPPKPVHVAGTNKGEELVTHKGREPGRDLHGRSYRDARDSTSINSEDASPIDSRMPQMPPA